MRHRKRKLHDAENGGVVDLQSLPVDASFGRANTFDRLFVHCLRVNKTSTKTEIFLEAMVLPNEVCILRQRDPLIATSIEFNESLHCESISGKRKKTALVLFPRDVVATVIQEDGTRIDLLSPVKGKLLEMNQRLLKEPNLVRTHYLTLGFLVVLQIDPRTLRKERSKDIGT